APACFTAASRSLRFFRISHGPAGRAIPGANPPLRDIPVARPEIPHPLSGSDGLPDPLLLSLLIVLGTLSLWFFLTGFGFGFKSSRQHTI
ncbi:hypothetical protein, partial [Pantoea vagans]|uniref:hypothetical protein n=1 Tax=Pantoea vagans TaxID=470934 RepID=UPI0023B18819